MAEQAQESRLEVMRKNCVCSILFTLITLLIQACVDGRPSNLAPDDFAFLERGMTYGQIVDGLGEPHDRIEKSTAFVIYVYELNTGEKVNLGFFPKANYLDSAYVFSEDGEEEQWLITTSQHFPSGLLRELTLSDFEGLTAGVQYFFDVYYQVGPPSISGLFEGGDVSLVYFLSDGGRVSMQTFGGYGCISRIGYSPKSFDADWTTLSEDTKGVCEKQ